MPNPPIQESPDAPERMQEVIARTPPNPEAARKALVSQWQSRIKSAKHHWAKDFKRMRKNMEFAKHGSEQVWHSHGNYTANIIQRHINQKVAALYAKNPTATAKRRERLEFVHWDGSMESLQAAQLGLQNAQLAGIPPDPQSAALVQDVMQGIQARKLFERIGKTNEILFHYFLNEGSQTFKRQAKQAVRRALVTGVAYMELGFQREFEKRPEITAQIEDNSTRLATIQALSADVADGMLRDDEAEMENLKLAILRLREQEEVIVREGPVFDWPKSTEIIPDPNCRQIEGWVGCQWIAREMALMPQQIKETWGVDVTKGGGPPVATDSGGKLPVNTRDGNTANTTGHETGQPSTTFVWKVWDKRTGNEYIVADGWPDFLVEPAAPDTPVEGFFPVFALQFNPVEDDQVDDPRMTRRFGLSEVELIQDMQKEYNAARQGLREHRHANRPGYVTGEGQLEAEDEAKLETHPPNAVVKLQSILPGQKVEELLQPVPKLPIDPAVYDVNPQFDDIMRTSGSQEANLGGTSGDTATEASIAEGSRATATQSNKDDLDDFLTEIARATGQLLMLNMSREEVTKIVGPGAVWPEFSATEAAEEVFLEIKAGSSGRPNKQLEIANLERVTPLLIQVPGVRPAWVAEKLLERIDDNLELADAFVDGLPSIIALNAMQQATAALTQQPENAGDKSGGTEDAPGAQGQEGANNAPQPGVNDGPQAAFPEPQGAA